MREALTIKMDGALLHGTVHRPRAAHQTGILFLNSGAQPRCSRGDLHAHLADHLAERGYLCVRVDLPGLGDSEGELPRDFADFYQLVESGGYTACAIRIATVVRERYRVANLLLLGICGGALTAVFAAATPGGKESIAGLVLLDLPFTFVPLRAPQSPAKASEAQSLLVRARLRLKRYWSSLHDWVLAQSWEPFATAAYRRLRGIRVPACHGGLAMPANINHPLLETFCGLVSKGLPALLITAHPPSEAPSFDFVGHVSHRTGHQVEHVKIHGTTHSFVENGGPEAVKSAVAAWLKRFERMRGIQSEPSLVDSTRNGKAEVPSLSATAAPAR